VVPPLSAGVPGPPSAGALRAEPNPFRDAIALALPATPRDTRLEIVDVAGRAVRGWAAPLPARLVWDGRDAAGHVQSAGVYFARLIGGGQTLEQRLVRLER